MAPPQGKTEDETMSRRNGLHSGPPKNAAMHASSASDSDSSNEDVDKEATMVTCDVLCSLMTSAKKPNEAASAKNGSSPGSKGGCTAEMKKKMGKACPKQSMLPMFLSKTYHMIDRCDAGVATWSDTGDNFVVKNVDKFAADVLPLYFKHSNFSSFARQLNFYGFRKLRSDPILTNDVDPQTSSYVRFYHDKFQRDKPELLHQIKRATKTDQQSKDEVDSLKQEVSRLKEELARATSDYERRIAELSYDVNRRISATNAEFEKLTALVQHLINAKTDGATAASAVAAAVAAAPAAARPTTTVPDLLHSLSHIAAASLQSHGAAALPQASGTKRKAEDDSSADEKKQPESSRSRLN